MYQIQEKPETQTQWPQAAPDSVAKSPLSSASLPLRPVNMSGRVSKVMEKAVKDIFDELDALADTVPGRNAITAVFKRFGLKPSEAFSNYAARVCPDTLLPEEEFLEIEAAHAKGQANKDDVLAIHFVTGAKPLDVLDDIRHLYPGRGLDPASFTALSRAFLSDDNRESGLIRTLNDLTGISKDDLAITLDQCLGRDLTASGGDPLRVLMKRVMPELAGTDETRLSSLTITAIAKVLAGERDDFQEIRERVRDEYTAAFDRMCNPKPHEIALPLAREAAAKLGKAAVFLFDSAITENLPEHIKNRIYGRRGRSPLDNIPRFLTSAAIDGALIGYPLLLLTPKGPSIFTVAFSGIVLGMAEIMLRYQICKMRSPESWPGNALIEGVYSGIQGFKNFVARIAEKQIEEKRRNRTEEQRGMRCQKT